MKAKKARQHPELAWLEGASGITDARAERILDVARQRQHGLMVLMEDLINPFNLAAIARTCDAFGVQQVGYMRQQSDYFNPHDAGALASRSASQWIDFTLYPHDTEATLNGLRTDGWHLVATCASQDALPLHEATLTHEKMVVLVGHEQKGISKKALALADTRVVIPMVGMVQSLNVSVATALVLYEIRAQRARGGSTLYSEEEAQALARRWAQQDSYPKRPY